jgi:hypothetical protein
MEDEQSYKSDKECKKVLQYIMEESDQFYRQIAPNGLKNSALVQFLHPTPEQQYEEYLRVRENLNRLSKEPNPAEEEKSIRDFEQDDLSSIAEYEEFLYLLGLTIYDIFSNNHEIISKDNKVYDLGSMRGSGQFIADYFNESFPGTTKYDYLDFYMGTNLIESRGDLTPLYEYIFKRLKNVGCDWKYSFPRLFAINLQKFSDPSKKDDLGNYQPEKSLEKQLEQKQKNEEVKNLQEKFDKFHDAEYEEAKYKPLITIVQAYKNVYGRLPEGHPQKEFE